MQTQSQKTPTGVTVVSVIAFIYGVGGFLRSAYGGVNAGAAPDQLRAQREVMSGMQGSPFTNTAFYDELIANAEAMVLPTIILELLAMVLSVGAIVIGAMAMMRKPSTVVWLPRVYGASAAFTVLHLGYTMWPCSRSSRRWSR